MRERKTPAKKTGGKARAERLSAALRANLKRRKEQARAKGASGDDSAGAASGEKKSRERPVNEA